jgi:hypothetical protein
MATDKQPTQAERIEALEEQVKKLTEAVQTGDPVAAAMKMAFKDAVDD